MANIINNNFHNVKIKCNKEDYWDFFMNQNDTESYLFSSEQFCKENLISYVDFCSFECVLMDDSNGHGDYVWDGAYTDNSILKNIGYTGFDNGLIKYRRDLICNKEFVELYQNSEYQLSETKVLQLHPVSGCNNLFDYPYEINCCDVELNGGFYQGFFKTKCGQYEILPSKLENGKTWSYEFVLKPSNLEKVSTKTLNDKYPENKGIFFYIGTRAENKWIYYYNKEYDESMYLGEYIEDGEIDVRKHNLTNFLDMEDIGNVKFGEEDISIYYEAVALDDYLKYKYYDKELYNKTDITDDYIDDSIFELKPNVIDEENNEFKEIGWCCGFNAKPYNIRQNYCDCNVSDTSFSNSCTCAYFSTSQTFGEDYLSDIDLLEDGLSYIENDLDISNFEFFTTAEIVVDKNQYYIDTDNKFLLFDRTINGFDIHNWEEGNKLRYVGNKSSFNGNLFLLMNRTPTGYTINDIQDLKDKYNQEYNYLDDLYNNALAFRITDEGAVGYRYFVLDCESETKYSIAEEYSKDGIVINEEWNVIHVKVESSFNKMKLLFYVNGNLVFISKELPMIDLRKLNEIDEKQETVPFNISLGGGTQGLIDVVLPNYMIDPYRHYPLEKHFAGTFIGYFKSFKMYDGNLESFDIFNNFKYEMNNLKNN